MLAYGAFAMKSINIEINDLVFMIITMECVICFQKIDATAAKSIKPTYTHLQYVPL